MVPHRSTNQARRCLTSLSRREAVLSLLYGTTCLQTHFLSIYTPPVRRRRSLHSLHHLHPYPTSVSHLFYIFEHRCVCSKIAYSKQNTKTISISLVLLVRRGFTPPEIGSPQSVFVLKMKTLRLLTPIFTSVFNVTLTCVCNL